MKAVGVWLCTCAFIAGAREIEAERGSSAKRGPSRQLPEGNLILGYAPSCDFDKVVAAAASGVNTIMWFSVNLAGGSDGMRVQTRLNLTCVQSVAAELSSRGLFTTHIVTVGGWDAPHPNTSWSGLEWWGAFRQWNEREVASMGWAGFDGIDWDLEGYDSQTSPYNHFTVECVELVGTMSMAAKEAGFLVTMVPPESYLDPTTTNFDLSLLHSYPEPWHPEFAYHGWNCYAAWLSTKYRVTPSGITTFDLVDIQLYESYAHAAYYIEQRGVRPSLYIANFVKRVVAGWDVDFSAVPNLGISTSRIAVHPSQLVLGFAFGSGDGKSVFIPPVEVSTAWSVLPSELRPRGVMYWNIMLDGHAANGTNTSYDFAKGFNAFLHTRQ